MCCRVRVGAGERTNAFLISREIVFTEKIRHIVYVSDLLSSLFLGVCIMNAKKCATHELNESIKRGIKWINEYRQQNKMLKESRLLLLHITSRLLDILGTNSKDFSKHRVYTNFYVTEGKPQICLTVADYIGFKGQELAEAIEYIMGMGFAEGRGQESAEYLSRNYFFDRPDVAIKLEVMVKSDSPTCRRVVIGKETVVQNKYKIECD